MGCWSLSSFRLTLWSCFLFLCCSLFSLFCSVLLANHCDTYFARDVGSKMYAVTYFGVCGNNGYDDESASELNFHFLCL